MFIYLLSLLRSLLPGIATPMFVVALLGIPIHVAMCYLLLFYFEVCSGSLFALFFTPSLRWNVKVGYLGVAYAGIATYGSMLGMLLGYAKYSCVPIVASESDQDTKTGLLFVQVRQAVWQILDRFFRPGLPQLVAVSVLIIARVFSPGSRVVGLRDLCLAGWYVFWNVCLSNQMLIIHFSSKPGLLPDPDSDIAAYSILFNIGSLTFMIYLGLNQVWLHCCWFVPSLAIQLEFCFV